MKRTTYLGVLSTILALALAACTSQSGGGPTAPTTPTSPAPTQPAAPATVTSISITGAQPMGSFQLTATAHRSDNTSEDATATAAWQSSNPQVAAVSTSGFVSVLMDGSADLTATYQGVTGTMHATVSVPATYTITGTVYDAASPTTTIANAHVQVLQVNSRAVTDANGRFTLTNVPAGRNLVETTADGYSVKESDVMVTSDMTLPIAMTAATTTSQ
jgi:hypothetical protein